MFPLDFFTLGYIGGLLADWTPAPFGLRGAIWLAAALAGLSFAARWRGRSMSPPGAPLALFLIAAGAASAVAIPAAHRWALPSHHLLRNLPRGEANIVGHLSRPVEKRGSAARKRPRIHIEVEKLFVRGVEISARGTVRITAAAALLSPISVGDRLLVRKVRLRPPRRHLNPGDFDYREFLRLRNVHAVAYASPKSVERLVHHERFGWTRSIYSFRERMRAHIQKNFPPEVSGLLESITLGVREDLDGALRESFRLAGASHILAISGLHVGFITAFFFFSFRALFRRLPPGAFPTSPVVMTPAKWAALLVIPIVIIFAVLTGARVSTVRAAIMAVVYLVTRLLERPGGALHSVFLAAFIILVLQPGFVWDTGFQLSFIAVAALIMAVRHLPRPGPGQTFREWGWWRSRLLQFAGIQGVVSVTMAPMTAWHFQEIHLAGLLTNFVLIPIASIAVPLTFVVSGFSAVLDAVSNFSFEALWLPFDLLLGFLARVMIFAARLGASVPAGTINVPPPTPLLIGFFLLSMLAALGTRAAAFRKAGWAAAALSMIFILKPLLPAHAVPSGRAVLMVPDAGHDDVVFIRLPDGRGYVIDAARKNRSGFDTWRNVLAPLLRTLDERDWSALFLLGNKGPGSNAEEALAAGMILRGVVKIERDGTLRSRSRVVGFTESFSPPGHRQGRILWRTNAGDARLSLRRLGWGHLAFELEQGGARWLLVTARGRRPIQIAHLPRGKFDLVRLPEKMLRENHVLEWLERIRPAVVVAAPGRTRRLPIGEWRQIRARQRALGVYRPHRQGMLRAFTEGKSLENGGRIEHYLPTAAWPRSRRSRWARYFPPGEKRYTRSPLRPKPAVRKISTEDR